MNVSFKPSVRVTDVKPVMFLAISMLSTLFASYGVDLFITSLTDGRHKLNSLHKKGLAMDIRIWQLIENNIDLEDFCVQVRAVLTAMSPQDARVWDVILENDHIHIEFDMDKVKSIANPDAYEKKVLNEISVRQNN